MLDSIENKVIESFDNYEIKLTGDDILTKFRHKKVKKVNKPALISSCLGFSFACALLVILVPNILNNEKEVINKKVNQKEYALELISASNSFDKLLPKEELVKKGLFDFDVEDILFSDFKNFESSAFINLNESNVEYEFKEEENTLYEITYSYKGIIKDNTLNQDYIFYYNMDEDQNIKGVFFNDFLEGNEVITIKVETFVSKVNDEYLLNSSYIPQVFGKDISYVFNVNDLDLNTKKYTYSLIDEEVFSYSIYNENNNIKISYSRFNEKTSIYEMSKLSESSYSVNFNLYDFIKGSFDVIYNLENKDYEIKNINFEF
jgi:hypothetical protein